MTKTLDKDKILINFCIFDDIIKALGMQGDKQQEMSNSEVLTVACIAHQYFSANYEATLSFLKSSEQSLFPKVLCKVWKWSLNVGVCSNKVLTPT